MLYDLPPEALSENVCKFFWKFSVFECTLKTRGFLKGSEDYAQPDWDKFTKEIDGRFKEIRVTGFEEACRKLESKPPKRQMVKESRLGWREIKRKEGQSYDSYIIALVKTVRNNLFHGGKYPDGPVEEIERDNELIDAALVVLEGLSQLLKKVKADV